MLPLPQTGSSGMACAGAKERTWKAWSRSPDAANTVTPVARWPIDHSASAPMAGEGQLVRRAEDAQVVVGDLAWQEERRFGKVRPARDVLHLGRAEAFAVEHHGDGVAAERLVGKGVDLLELAHYVNLLLQYAQ